MHIWIINLFSDLPGEGAGEGRFLTLSKVFADMGHEVTWWTMDFHHRTKSRRGENMRQAAELELQQYEFSGSIRIRMVPVPKYFKNISFKRIHSHRSFAKQLLKLAQPARQLEPPERIVVSSPPLTAGEVALELGRMYQCPVALDLTDQWPNTFERVLPGGSKLRKCLGHVFFYPQYALARRLYREASYVSAVSQEYLDDAFVCAPLQRMHLCYIGGNIHSSSVIKNASSPAQPVRFIYVGAMTSSYDLVTILEAARLLRDMGHAFEIHFAGSGYDEAKLRQYVDQNELSEHCQFHGFLRQNKLNMLLDEMDVGLNAIRTEIAITMPHKLSDYLCAGLPVINSLPGEADALLRNAGCGRFYTAGNAPSLAEVMKVYFNSDILSADRQHASALATRGFDRSQTYPNWARAIIEQ